MNLVANLLMRPSVKKNNFENRAAFIKAVNEYQVARFYGPRCINNTSIGTVYCKLF